jgi:hypothetical protein
MAARPEARVLGVATASGLHGIRSLPGRPTITHGGMRIGTDALARDVAALVQVPSTTGDDRAGTDGFSADQ